MVHLADPQLRGQFPKSTLKKVIDLAFMCLREDAKSRPTMLEVIPAMDFITSHPYDPDKANKEDTKDSGDSSPTEKTRMLNKDLERERAVAEAKKWGESWREKRKQIADDAL